MNKQKKYTLHLVDEFIPSPTIVKFKKRKKNRDMNECDKHSFISNIDVEITSGKKYRVFIYAGDGPQHIQQLRKCSTLDTAKDVCSQVYSFINGQTLMLLYGYENNIKITHKKSIKKIKYLDDMLINNVIVCYVCDNRGNIVHGLCVFPYH